jgi:hypothetical protein
MPIEDFAILAITLLIAFLVYTRTIGRKVPIRFGAPPSVPASPRPIVTIAANDILLDADFRVRPPARAHLRELSKRACVYLIVVVRDRAHADSVRAQLLRELDECADADCVLFCQTAVGRAAIARQLEPALHLDFDPAVVHEVALFFRAVLVARAGLSSPHAVCHCLSFAEFMESHAALVGVNARC